MRKLTFLLFALMVFFSTKSLAVDVITSGKYYYIQNVESGLFLCGANDWGTKASVATEGALFKLEGTNNVYPIQHIGTGTYLGNDLFTDQGALNPGWTISPVEGETDVFTIYNSTKGYLAKGSQASKGFYAEAVTGITPNAQWRILTRDEAIAQLKNATKDNGRNASFLISNPGFNRNVSTAGWTVSDDCTNKNLSGGDTKHMAVNYCAESYHSKFTISQTLENIPNGDYKVTVQAFYDGTPNGGLPVLFANNSTKEFGTKTGGENSMATAATAFQDGTKYLIEVSVTVTNNTLQLGVRNTDNTNLWCIWDNFELTYYGLDLSKFETEFNTALTNAKSVKTDSPMNKDVLAALTKAIEDYDGKSYASVEDYSVAIDALNEATDKAKTSIDIYAKVKILNDKVATYDTDGQNAYQSTMKSYNDCTLTDYESAFMAFITATKAQTTADSDMTGAILNPSFEDGLAEWSNNGMAIQTNNDFGKTGANYAEAWQPKGTKGVSQTISDLKKGQYKLKVHVLSRGITSGNVFINGTRTDFVISDLQNDYEITSMVDGDAKIGVTAEGNNGAKNSWFAVDNFQLKYLGATEYPELTALTGTMNKDVEDKQKSALEAYNNNKTIETFNAAQEAINAAEASIKAYSHAYSALEAQKTLIEATNVYDTNGFNTYKNQYSTNQEKYDERTLTTEEAETIVNPDIATAHRASTAYNFLLTPWTIGGVQCNAFDKSLYINTWSVEGDTDGSNFKVPFFEYWIDNAKSLAHNTISASIPELEKGLYEVSLLARVRINDIQKQNTPVGITLSANDGTPVNVCGGDKVGSTQFYLKEFKAIGQVSDGNLTITFDIQEGNNISWFSFKNVKYRKLTDDETKLTVTLASSGMSTFSSQYEFKVSEGLEAYYAESCDGEVVKMKKLENGIIPAETGVVLMGAGGEDYIVALSATGAEAVEDNLLIAATTSVELPATTDGNKNYVLVEGMFHPYTGTAHVGAGKAYLQLNENPEAKSLMLDFSSADGIADIANDKAATNEEYSLLGTRISNGYKGIVIKNGKKILRK